MVQKFGETVVDAIAVNHQPDLDDPLPDQAKKIVVLKLTNELEQWRRPKRFAIKPDRANYSVVLTRAF